MKNTRPAVHDMLPEERNNEALDDLGRVRGSGFGAVLADTHSLLEATELVRDKNGTLVHARGTIQDVTEQTQVISALRASEERLNQTQHIAHIGSWELDLVSDVLTWSDETYRIFGMQDRGCSMTYEAFLERVHPDDRAAVDAAYTTSIRDGLDTYEVQHRIMREGTGEIRYVHERCRHIRDADGRIIRSRGMIHDISDRKRGEAALQDLRRTLDARVAERTGELSSLKAVMTSVSQSLDLMAMVPASLAAIARAAEADITMLFLREGNEIRFLRAHYREGCEAHAASRGIRRIGECLCGLAAAGAPVFSTDIRVDGRRLHAECMADGIAGFAALPLNAAGQTLGVLCVTSLTPRDFQLQADFFASLAQDLSVALQNVLLYEQERRQAESLRAEIEARKRAETELRRREREVATLVEHSPDIIMRFDREFRHLYVSPAVRRVIDRDPREWLGKTCAEVGFPERWYRYWESVLDRVFRTGKPAQEEYDYEGDRGTVTLDWRLVPEFDARGNVETVLSIFRDITPMREAEARRLAAEERFRMLIEHSPDGLALNTADGKILFHSPSVQRILGYAPDELAGSSSHELIHPEDLPRIQHEVMPALISAPGTVVRARMRMRHKDGTWRHLDTVATNMLHLASVEAIVINYRDITPEVEALDAQRKAEAELAAQQLMAVRADRLRSLGEMAAGIAHELNQPVGGIRALAEQNLIALQRQWRIAPSELEQELRLIVEQADRMSHIINHVRLFARDAGSPAVQAVDVNEVVESSIGLVCEQLRARGIAVDQELQQPLPSVESNPFSLEEVLLNLYRNAEQAIGTDRGDAGGRIGIRTRVVEEGQRQWICIDVSDNASGIAPDIASRVFEPFFTTKDPDAGTGLGLPICRSIVDSYGGRIRLDSRPGQGTTAVVMLPAMEAGVHDEA